jgi:hypothetical protein
VDTNDRPNALSEAATRAPWYRRVLPTTLGVLVVIAVAATLLPGFRHQLDLSLTRQPVSYVELYFARSTSAGAQAACLRKGTAVRARFVIESHLTKRQPVAYRVIVDPATNGVPTQRQPGSAQVSPGRAIDVTKSFRVPRGEAYVISVTLPSSNQQVRVRCPARKS